MPRLLGALAATGVILGAVYLLYMFQKVFFGKLDKAKNGKLPDLDGARAGRVRARSSIAIFLDGSVPAAVPRRDGAGGAEASSRDFRRRVAEPDGPPHVYGVAAARAGRREQRAPTADADAGRPTAHRRGDRHREVRQ